MEQFSTDRSDTLWQGVPLIPGCIKWFLLSLSAYTISTHFTSILPSFPSCQALMAFLKADQMSEDLFLFLSESHWMLFCSGLFCCFVVCLFVFVGRIKWSVPLRGSITNFCRHTHLNVKWCCVLTYKNTNIFPQETSAEKFGSEILFPYTASYKNQCDMKRVLFPK